jgi:hypothetical protein
MYSLLNTMIVTSGCPSSHKQTVRTPNQPARLLLPAPRQIGSIPSRVPLPGAPTRQLSNTVHCMVITTPWRNQQLLVEGTVRQCSH